MYKNLQWKFLAIAAVTLVAIWAFVPPAQSGAPWLSKIKLGLDLKGGVHLVYQVQTDDALKVETETSSEQLNEALKTAGVTVGAVRVIGLTEFQVDGVPAASDGQFRTIAQAQVGLSFNRDQNADGSYVFKMKPNIEVNRRSEAVAQASQAGP